jgi:putative endonuclease
MHNPVMAGLVPAIHEGVAASPAPLHDRKMYGNAWVYIVTNRPNGILYTGVTSDIAKRAWEHREGVVDGFTKRYGLKRLVYVERHADILTAIQREKNMKHWSRTWKVRLILAANPDWNDLYDQTL